jgi:hypothetical protein
MSALTGERHSPEGERVAVESSHDGALSRLPNQNPMRSDLMMAAKQLQHGGDPELLGGDRSWHAGGPTSSGGHAMGLGPSRSTLTSTTADPVGGGKVSPDALT